MRIVVTNDEYEIVASLSKDQNGAWEINYRGKTYHLNSNGLMQILEIPVEDRKIILDKIFEIEKTTPQEFLRKFIEVRFSESNDGIECIASISDIEMKAVFRKVEDSIAIIEFPKNVSIPQYYMFEKYMDRIAQLDTSTTEEIKDFLKDYATSYVVEELEERLL